jgi:hypothetical protein
MLNQGDENACYLVSGQWSVGLVPLIEPVAHAQQGEGEELGRERREPPGVDAFADHSFDEFVIGPAFGPCSPRHLGRQVPFLAEEDRKKIPVISHEAHLVADDLAQLLFRRHILRTDLPQPALEDGDRAFEHTGQ